MNKKKIWTVSQVNARSKQILEENFLSFWLQGEVSNLKIHSSGHIYFSLKDEHSQIPVVYFNGREQAERINLEDGKFVHLYGTLSLYIAQGRYQFIAQAIEELGEGLERQRFEELKKKLSKEGLFDEKHKKKLPFLPRKIGLITSQNGAAIADFLSIIDRRFPKVEIKVFPISVQGKTAATDAINAIKYFNQESDCDVLVLTRGGGSAEDLGAFNDEDLARAIFLNKIPLLSAIGHEIDFTICDFVADLRCPTPSAAAELIIERQDYMEEKILGFKLRLSKAIKDKLFEHKNNLEKLKKYHQLLSPKNMLYEQRQYLDKVYDTLLFQLKTIYHNEKNFLDLKKQKLLNFYQQVKNEKQRLKLISQKLFLLNPLNILKRGYSLARNKKGEIIALAKQAKEEETFDLLFKDSAIEVKFNKNV